MLHEKSQIRSFVLREGRMTSGQKNALMKLWSVYGLALTESTIDLTDIFQRQAPTFLEIGFGMGDALIQMAQAHPENNYLGIEVHRPGIGKVLASIDAKALTNIRIYEGDAMKVLAQCIPANSLEGVMLFFPDPWPKKRHHKRRLVQTGFITLIHRVLKPGAFFHLATDWQEYADHMLAVMESRQDFMNPAGPSCYTPRPLYRPLTKFEKRGIRLGHEVRDLIYRTLSVSRE